MPSRFPLESFQFCAWKWYHHRRLNIHFGLWSQLFVFTRWICHCSVLWLKHASFYKFRLFGRYEQVVGGWSVINMLPSQWIVPNSLKSYDFSLTNEPICLIFDQKYIKWHETCKYEEKLNNEHFLASDIFISSNMLNLHHSTISFPYWCFSLAQRNW